MSEKQIIPEFMPKETLIQLCTLFDLIDFPKLTKEEEKENDKGWILQGDRDSDGQLDLQWDVRGESFIWKGTR